MTRLSMSAQDVSRRLALASAAARLDPAHRLDSKIDLSPAGLTRRLREVSQLNELCRRLRAR